jgi:hypothetical protein
MVVDGGVLSLCWKVKEVKDGGPLPSCCGRLYFFYVV